MVNLTLPTPGTSSGAWGTIINQAFTDLNNGKADIANVVPSIAAPWTAYTPTVTGFTSVVTTPVGYYVQIGKTCHVRVSVTIGAVTTLGSTGIGVSLPLQASSTQGTNRFVCGIYRANAGQYVPCGVAIGNNNTTFAVYTQTPNAATTNMSGWSGAAPTGQVAGDFWSWNFTYETA